MDEIWKIVIGIVASIGGIGTVIIMVIRVSVNIITDRLEQKYTQKLSKELEKYKLILDNKAYVTKIKFDAEFHIYRELSTAFFQMVKSIVNMIPASRIVSEPVDSKEREKRKNEAYNQALKMTIVAQDTLRANAAFIQESLVEKYSSILKLCNLQLTMFEMREYFSNEDFERSRTIMKNFEEVNEKIREYLFKIDMLE